jgi:hypothetical protein
MAVTTKQRGRVTHVGLAYMTKRAEWKLTGWHFIYGDYPAIDTSGSEPLYSGWTASELATLREVCIEWGEDVALKVAELVR